ncbi:MAG TPA: Ku protein [Longimicrobium sp.]|nr:Ku protein [Longimicrobium sp.]
MARAIWKGSISFGLVTIPVGLFSAETRDEISFRQLDKNNLAPIGYKKYNKQTGKEVETEDIVKGYEYEEDRYVLISDEDLKRANPEKTQTVEITDFVDLDDIDPAFFDKPYYLAPLKKNAKAYALLREALKRSRKVGIAKVVIRTREYLAAVIPQGDVLVLEILRYPHEIRGTDDLDVPAEDLEKLQVSDRELEMAQMLIDGMTGSWDPAKYHDSYRDDLMAMIQRRVESGNTEVIDETPVPDIEPRTDVIDIMSLLKKSVEQTTKERAAAGGSTAPAAAAEPVRPKAAKKAAAPAKSPSASPAKVASLKAAPASKPAPAAKTASSTPQTARPKSTSAKKPRLRKTA